MPQFLKFIKALLEFKGHYEIYKERCLHLPQKEVLADNLYLYRLFYLPAAEYIKEKKIERVTADYVSKFAYACTGADINTISAFDFLNVCLGLVLPIYQLKFSKEDIINKIGNNLIFDSITNISGSKVFC